MRRAILGAVIAAPLVLLASCAAQTTTAQVAADVSRVAESLTLVLPQIGALNHVPADKLAMMTAAVADLQTAAGQLAIADASASNAALALRIETDMETALSALTPLMGILPPEVKTVVLSIEVLAPVIETALGLAVPAAPPATTAAHVPA